MVKKLGMKNRESLLHKMLGIGVKFRRFEVNCAFLYVKKNNGSIIVGILLSSCEISIFSALLGTKYGIMPVEMYLWNGSKERVSLNMNYEHECVHLLSGHDGMVMRSNRCSEFCETCVFISNVP